MFKRQIADTSSRRRWWGSCRVAMDPLLLLLISLRYPSTADPFFSWYQSIMLSAWQQVAGLFGASLYTRHELEQMHEDDRRKMNDARMLWEHAKLGATRRIQPEMPQAFHSPRLQGQDLFEVSVDELQQLYSSGAFTALEYTRFCLNRIHAINPYLEAIIETNPDACDDAEALDLARKFDGETGTVTVRGPLYGVPILVKDVGD